MAIHVKLFLLGLALVAVFYFVSRDDARLTRQNSVTINRHLAKQMQDWTISKPKGQ